MKQFLDNAAHGLELIGEQVTEAVAEVHWGKLALLAVLIVVVMGVAA